MKRLFTSICLCLTLIGSAASLNAQDFGRDRGSRDRGDRSSWGDRDRGDRDRGDRGDRGSFGGFGGPPGGFTGGFGGGPPGFGGGPPGFGGGPPGFGGPPGGSSGRSMLDSNGNGRIDQEEIDRMPSFVRDMMRSRGIELKAGMSVDDMRNSFRGAPGGAPPNGSQPGQPGQNDSNNTAGAAKVLVPYRMKPKQPLTLTLPPAYSEIDTDFDGQLGLHEWLVSRRTDLERFDEMDTDFDGFLTPEELQAADKSAAENNVAAAAGANRTKLTIIAATPTRSQQQSRSNNRSPNSPPGSWNGSGGNDPNAYANMSFDRLDGNRDGFVDADEWQQSRRVRGMFEQAGIRVDRMSKDQFLANFQRLSAGSNTERR
jgi:hypothetical protein